MSTARHRRHHQGRGRPGPRRRAFTFSGYYMDPERLERALGEEIMGHHFGLPFRRAPQRRIVLACLDHLVHARERGAIRDLPVTWAEARREGMEIERALGRRPAGIPS